MGVPILRGTLALPLAHRVATRSARHTRRSLGKLTATATSSQPPALTKCVPTCWRSVTICPSIRTHTAHANSSTTPLQPTTTNMTDGPSDGGEHLFVFDNVSTDWS